MERERFVVAQGCDGCGEMEECLLKGSGFLVVMMKMV